MGWIGSAVVGGLVGCSASATPAASSPAATPSEPQAAAAAVTFAAVVPEVVPARAQTVSAFRCALDNRPGMLVMDLGDGLYAAWDTREGLLYKVWRGDVELTGTVYDTRHGPRPTARGTVLFAALPSTREAEALSTRPAAPPEVVRLASPDSRRWAGHRLETDHIVLLMVTPAGEKTVRVSRNPDPSAFPVLFTLN